MSKILHGIKTTENLLIPIFSFKLTFPQVCVLEIFSLLPGHVAGVKSGLENFLHREQDT